MASLATPVPTSFERTAAMLLRLALVVIFLTFGIHKFTTYEAVGISGFVTNSPLTMWLSTFGTQGASNVVGIAEIAVGVLLAVGFARPGSILAVAGAAGGIATFAVTLSFMLTTPGVFAPNQAPILTADVGQFLSKDMVLLAGCLVLLARSLADRRAGRALQAVAPPNGISAA